MFKKSIAAQRPFKLALIASIALLGAASAPSFAANSTTATASATVLTPINVSKSTDLNFGKFVASAAGTVTVSTSGARTFSGVTLMTGVTPTAASFSITGEPSATYTIDTTTGTSTTLTSGANTMPLALYSDLTGGNATSGTVSSGTLSAGGAQTLYVGGQLTVGAGQAPGAYTGTVAVAVNYN
jgi:spore coat protein U-like protein